ncbi:MAG: tetratricopeptide repeat protein [Cyanobacteria bacterium SZAS LIN-5]|nr:tetratricopeptide repeat protein [Cyanobacteria bacterium SZAS LIN-5]
MKRTSLWCFSVATVLLAGGCSKTLTTSEATRKVEKGQNLYYRSDDAANPSSSSSSREASALVAAQNQQLSGFNAEVETAVAEQSLIAWRKALAGDEKGSLAMLDKLDEKYPDILTLKFMRGQILEHFGKKKEALKYYQMAVTGNEFSSIKLFKLAEIKRTTGDAKGAVEDYRLLVQRAPDFAPAKLGLAQSLLALDKNSEEGKKLVEEVLAAEPANKEAKAIQLTFKSK